MKIICALLFALGCIHLSTGEGLKCTLKPAELNVQWRDMVNPCIQSMEKQIKVEIHASMTYLAMGAFFAQDSQNRLGFSKLFFENANEEREHAIKVMDYLLMRGELNERVSHLVQFPVTVTSNWTGGFDALTAALTLENRVTSKIRDIIHTCETSKVDQNTNDYHLVDYLITDFLDEQLKGQRQLAERMSTLGKMITTHGSFGEFLFDKKLLMGEV